MKHVVLTLAMATILTAISVAAQEQGSSLTASVQGAALTPWTFSSQPQPLANPTSAQDSRTVAQAVSPAITPVEPRQLTVAAPPQFKVGDTWIYEGGGGAYTWRIKEVSVNSIVAENSAGIAYRFSPEGNRDFVLIKYSLQR